MKSSTYNHLISKLQVVLIVKYVESVDEAYWLLLKDAQAPADDHETMTVCIPKNHRLSSIDWDDIHRYVRGVTDVKLAAMRRHQLQS